MKELDRFAEAFREEAGELLEELEKSLMQLEETPEDGEIVGRVFRAMHTLKGSSSMFGFDRIASLTHDIENVYDQVREGKLSISKKMIDLTLKACDLVKVRLSGEGEEPGAEREILDGFKAFLGKVEEEAAPITEKVEIPKSKAREITYRVRFIPPKDLFFRGMDPLSLVDELKNLGVCHLVAHVDAIPLLEEFAPENLYIHWDIVVTTSREENALRDVFIFVEDDSEIVIEKIDDGLKGEDDELDYKRLGDILVEKGDMSVEDMSAVLHKQKRFGEMAVEQGVVSPELVESALMEQKHVRELREKRVHSEVASTLKVPSERVDSLVNLVGELVTMQARLNQVSVNRNDTALLTISEEMERLVWDLRDKTMSIRMLPIEPTFGKFKRLVRDLSGELGKEVELVTEGEETELDKTVIEHINDPLVHLIRNSVDHGIEMPEEREKLGKNRKGTIYLSAGHSGAFVLIQVRDDGGGLNTEVIREKAIEKGLIAGDSNLSEKEINELIFAPGFSTAKHVTNVSGRGVGMDVVRKSMDTLKASIGVESKRGFGTTITLKIPLTLAIIDGLLVKIGEDSFVLPLSVVQECVELKREDRLRRQGQNTARVRDELVPYIRLRDKFSIVGAEPEIEQIVITEVEGMRVGFVIDSVIGQYQTVIKSLGSFYKRAKGLSGATILGDGTIALILDLNQLVKGEKGEEPLLQEPIGEGE